MYIITFIYVNLSATFYILSKLHEHLVRWPFPYDLDMESMWDFFTFSVNMV